MASTAATRPNRPALSICAAPGSEGALQSGAVVDYALYNVLGNIGVLVIVGLVRVWLERRGTRRQRPAGQV